MSSSSKKLACKGTLRQGFTSLRSRTPPPPTLYSIQYMYAVYLFTHRRVGGRGGGELNQREGEKGNSSQSVENTNMTDCISSL